MAEKRVERAILYLKRPGRFDPAPLRALTEVELRALKGMVRWGHDVPAEMQHVVDELLAEREVRRLAAARSRDDAGHGREATLGVRAVMLLLVAAVVGLAAILAWLAR
jgi:hypothetical protein